MGVRPFRLPAAVFVIAVLLGPGGNAETTVLAPPFNDVFEDQFCDGWELASCEASVDADEDAATVALNVALESPAQGSAPWRGTGEAGAYFRKVGVLAAGVATMELTTTFAIHHAAASIDSMLADLGSPFVGHARVYIDVFMQVFGCTCVGSAHRILVTSDGAGPSAIDDEVLTLTIPVVNEDGGSIPAGEFELWVSVYGDLSLHHAAAPDLLPDAGRAALDVEATITGVSAATT